MDPYWQDGNLTIYQGHVLDVLKAMPAASVHCVVTSPPYWGLRDYKLEPQVWGGDSDCVHECGIPIALHQRGKVGDNSTLEGGSQRSESDDGPQVISQGTFCVRCGAWRGSLGLEPTPDLYVQHLVEVFREVQRVLRREGVLFLNMGDGYASAWPAPNTRRNIIGNAMAGGKRGPQRQPKLGWNLKEKDLIGMPWRVAFALQGDGWWLRSDIIWSKPNPMPESVIDRPTRAHEYVFLLAKSERYYYDADAIREPHSWDGQGWAKGWMVGKGSHDTIHPDGRTTQAEADEYRRKTVEDPNYRGRRQAPEPGEPNAFHPLGRNKRSVWEIPTEPFPEAHFATFPVKLVAPCIKAGCPVGGVVLDVFMGSGTVLLVAKRLGRAGVGIELKSDYCEMAKRRIIQEPQQIGLLVQ